MKGMWKGGGDVRAKSSKTHNVTRAARRHALPAVDRRNARGSWSTGVAEGTILGAAVLIFSTLTGAPAFAEQRNNSSWL